jgi:hypothetical protein
MSGLTAVVKHTTLESLASFPRHSQPSRPLHPMPVGLPLLRPPAPVRGTQYCCIWTDDGTGWESHVSEQPFHGR